MRLQKGISLGKTMEDKRLALVDVPLIWGMADKTDHELKAILKALQP